jgi:mannonate dehydratase
MKRRKFLSLTGLAAATAGAGGFRTLESAPAREANDPARKPVKMHVGTQRGPTNAERLQYFKRHGVNHICGYPPNPGQRGYWTVEDLVKTRELCEKHGVQLPMVALPFLSSSHIDRERRGAIMLADSPERDRDIEHIQKMIVACAKAGIPALKYNMSLLGVLRTERTPGRGGSTYSTWRLRSAKPKTRATRAGKVTEDMAWERITYFLDRVIPVCNEYKIRAACHPHDPGVAPKGYQGIVRVLGTVDGLKRFASIQESPYHGFNLCLGTTAEMLQDPRTEIHDVIRYLGQRKKIFNIHFRNIRGRRDDFQEVYPDEGDMDMLQVARTLYEVDYEYMLMPDHMPVHPDDPGGRQAFAYGYGYIKGLLQAVAAYG